MQASAIPCSHQLAVAAVSCYTKFYSFLTYRQHLGTWNTRATGWFTPNNPFYTVHPTHSNQILCEVSPLVLKGKVSCLSGIFCSVLGSNIMQVVLDKKFKYNQIQCYPPLLTDNFKIFPIHFQDDVHPHQKFWMPRYTTDFSKSHCSKGNFWKGFFFFNFAKYYFCVPLCQCAITLYGNTNIKTQPEHVYRGVIEQAAQFPLPNTYCKQKKKNLTMLKLSYGASTLMGWVHFPFSSWFDSSVFCWLFAELLTWFHIPF